MGEISLFCYGTLQSPLVMKAVTGKAYNGQEAVLQDWARYRFLKTEYPGVVKEAGSTVNGKVFCDLDNEAVAKLDDFEGDKYDRLILDVTLDDGSRKAAYVYVVKDHYKKQLSGEHWEFDRFLQKGLERFIQWFVEDRRDLFDRGDL